MDNNETTDGEKLTFFQLFSEKKWKVEIPIIQRDYAQGRKTSNAIEIRDTFLNTLNEHLDKSKNIDLDFVYGSLSESDNSLFIPLDGQQRLTTLFLLHWYLASKDGKKQIFDTSIVENNKSKFTYETRTSSREFCDFLVSRNISIDNLLVADEKKSNSLSKTIRDNAMYFSSWDNDPTIQSMLTMLDAIHEKFQSKNGYFEKLIDDKDRIITFQFLNLKKFKLTDDLYIKMNARGKELTPFENFKAKFEQFISELKFQKKTFYKLNYLTEEKDVTVQEFFSHKIDTDWANLFWNYRDKKTHIFDNQLMNFIRVIATNQYALKEKNIEKLENLKLLIGKESPDLEELEPRPITFLQYNEIGCLDEEMILNLISIFELLINENEKIKKYLVDGFYYDEEKIFNEVINNSLTYTKRIQFYAFYQYLIFNMGDTVGLNEWMRIIYNLSENTIYNRTEEFARSMKSIESLLPHSLDILNYLTDHNNNVSGFLDIQIQEERIKASLILRSSLWNNVIIEIEKHAYFNGQIAFILNFSNIEEYFNTNKNCDWSEDEDKKFIKIFSTYSEKAKAVFDENGLKKFSNFVWERALLSKGNYLLTKGLNHSFLIDNDRDISWKRLLRDDNSEKRQYVKQVFDDNYFNASDVQYSLEKIISNSKLNNWRQNFVELPAILEYLGYKKYIRFIDQERKIYLLKKERMSGEHSEYYSYGFYKSYLETKQFQPFNNNFYHEVSGGGENPCAVLNEWKYEDSNYAIDITHDLEDFGDDIFILKFFDRNKHSFHDQIIKVMEENNFNISDSKDYFYLHIPMSDEKVLDTLNSICESFQRLLS